MISRLHITNGDILAEKLKTAGVTDEILSWRESYYEGPLGPDDLRDEWLPERSAYFERIHGVSRQLFIELTAEQEARLNRDVQQIVLWFEYDLYDQTMLSRIVDLLLTAKQDHKLPEIYLVTARSYPGIEPFFGFGQLTSEQIAQFLHPDRWLRLTLDHLVVGQSFWRAYTSNDPRKLEQFIQSNRVNASYPYARDAFFFHLQRFPSTYNGLNTIEQFMLSQLVHSQSRTISITEWFKRTSRQFPVYGMSDIVFRTTISDGVNVSRPIWVTDQSDAKLTDFGQDVFAGKKDFICENGMDRWLGNVHLYGKRPLWRWNNDEETFVKYT